MCEQLPEILIRYHVTTAYAAAHYNLWDAADHRPMYMKHLMVACREQQGMNAVPYYLEGTVYNYILGQYELGYRAPSVIPLEFAWRGPQTFGCYISEVATSKELYFHLVGWYLDDIPH